MPSPLAHSAMGYLMHRISETPAAKPETPQPKWTRRLLTWLFSPSLWALLMLSSLPDLDAVAGLLFGNMGAFHNNASHSLMVALLVGLVVGLLAYARGAGFRTWFLLASGSYAMHVIMDFFTYDSRGVMLFWPFTPERFASPVPIFYGVRWSEGLFAPQHLITIATELVFVALMFLVAEALVRAKAARRPRLPQPALAECSEEVDGC